MKGEAKLKLANVKVYYAQPMQKAYRIAITIYQARANAQYIIVNEAI